MFSLLARRLRNGMANDDLSSYRSQVGVIKISGLRASSRRHGIRIATRKR